MKKLLTVIILGLAVMSSAAQAAPPSSAQIERLLQVMEAQKIVDQMIPAMMQQSRMMVEQNLAKSDTSEADTSEADKARANQVMASQEASLRAMLSWTNLKPVYLRVYSDTLSAEEVLAMTRFYESPEGRSVMQKMPQILQRTMVELQPLAQSAMEKMMADLETEMAPPTK